MAVGNQPADIDDTVGIGMAVIGTALNILKDIRRIKLDGCPDGKKQSNESPNPFADFKGLFRRMFAHDKETDSGTNKHQRDP